MIVSIFHNIPDFEVSPIKFSFNQATMHKSARNMEMSSFDANY